MFAVLSVQPLGDCYQRSLEVAPTEDCNRSGERVATGRPHEARTLYR